MCMRMCMCVSVRVFLFPEKKLIRSPVETIRRCVSFDTIAASSYLSGEWPRSNHPLIHLNLVHCPMVLTAEKWTQVGSRRGGISEQRICRGMIDCAYPHVDEADIRPKCRALCLDPTRRAEEKKQDSFNLFSRNGDVSPRASIF